MGLMSLGIVGCQHPSHPPGEAVTVHRVINGQTLEITRPASPTVQRVRLIGLDAPHLKQIPWGVESRNALEQLIKDQPVYLEFDQQPQDQYQRQLAYLWQGDRLINEQLVKQGYALAVVRSPNNRYGERLAHAQEWARIMGVGIWNPQNPLRQTPAQFMSQLWDRPQPSKP